MTDPRSARDTAPLLPDVSEKQLKRIADHLRHLARYVSRPSRGFKLTRRERDDGLIEYQITAEEPEDLTQIGYIQSTRHDAAFVQAVLAQAPLFDRLLAQGEAARDPGPLQPARTHNPATGRCTRCDYAEADGHAPTCIHYDFWRAQQAAGDPGPPQPRAFWLSNMAEQMQESRSPDGDGLGKTGTERETHPSGGTYRQHDEGCGLTLDVAPTGDAFSSSARTIASSSATPTPSEKPRAGSEPADSHQLAAGDPGLRVPLEQQQLKMLHRYTITSEGASLGYFRLVEDPSGVWVTWAEVDALLARATPRVPAPPQEQ